MKVTQRQLLDAYEEGKKAFAEGVSISENPYREEGVNRFEWRRHDVWTNGWKDRHRQNAMSQNTGKFESVTVSGMHSMLQHIKDNTPKDQLRRLVVVTEDGPALMIQFVQEAVDYLKSCTSGEGFEMARLQAELGLRPDDVVIFAVEKSNG